MDEERFFQALDQVVRDPNFNADNFGDHIETAAGVRRQADGSRTPEVQHYVHAAWAVRGYLKATGAI